MSKQKRYSFARKILWAVVAAAVPVFAGAEESLSFSRDIQPILSDKCFACHGPDEGSRKGKLRLDVEADARRVLGTGAADSEAFARMVHEDPDERMPPVDSGKSMTEAQVAKIRVWLDAGAKYEQHWAFVAPVRAALPMVKDAAWPRNAVDHFILARQEAEGLSPSPEADAVTLLRRVHLDLVGLPPTPEEVDLFLAESAEEVNRPLTPSLSPDGGEGASSAYERVVDRLLASPHFGERWGRHWLDAARYADSNGYSIDAPRSIWPYRDWVINAINNDLPFDEFVIQQYAGDLLPDATSEMKVATGFHRNTMINEEGGVDPEEFRVESIIDRVNTTGTVLLGLTMSCARCHTHKYDPITQEEYFKLFAFLNNDEEPTLSLPTPEQEEETERLQRRIRLAERRLREYLEGPGAAAMAAWESGLDAAAREALKQEERDALAVPAAERSEEQHKVVLGVYRQTDAELRHLEGEVKRNENKLPKPPTTMVLAARSTPRETRLLTQGDFARPAQVVMAGVPAALHDLPPDAQGTRLDLARWLVSRENPLTARVTVNRYWMHLFGRGIVETDDDFGLQAIPPTHPELLDWLAVEFMESGWRVKPLLRLLVTSATYRQASHARPEVDAVDPRNQLLARQNRLRLDAEIIRDSALTAAEVLNPAVGGPSVFPPQPDGVMSLGQQNRAWRPDKGPERYRRGMYTYFWRATPHPALTVFDAPDAQATCTRRVRSTTPLQALTLLNDAAYYELAQALGERIAAESAGDPAAGIEQIFRRCLGRGPSAEEAAIVRALLDKEEQSWAVAARALLNLDEFITRE